MGTWSMIWATVKGLVCPGTSIFLEVTDLALNALNSQLAKGSVSEAVAKTCAIAEKALDILDRYADWCPEKWQKEFDTIRALVRKFVVALSDSKVDAKELEELAKAVKIAYAEWQA